jgi:PPOX class probable F420-dependent enzyme
LDGYTFSFQRGAVTLELEESTGRFIREHRVARLATADASGQPSVIPICYVLEGGCLYSALDEKPKNVEPARLKRVRNIRANPRVSLVIDDYSEDWGRLAYVQVKGLAEIIEPGGGRPGEHERAVLMLKEKYPQYRLMAIEARPVIKITPTRVKRWGA